VKTPVSAFDIYFFSFTSFRGTTFGLKIVQATENGNSDEEWHWAGEITNSFQWWILQDGLQQERWGRHGRAWEKTAIEREQRPLITMNNLLMANSEKFWLHVNAWIHNLHDGEFTCKPNSNFNTAFLLLLHQCTWEAVFL
jgi:hypothetical protein